MFWFSAFMLNTVVALGIGYALNRHLRNTHPGEWSGLGKPWFYNSVQTQWRCAKYYLFSAKYRELNDPVFNRLVLAIRILNIVELALLAAMVLAARH